MQKIDILLPYWGDFILFKEAVESVLRQTESNWRLIIFDDHYSSLEAKEYINGLNEPRILYHRHKNNIGITRNFNFALEAANAEYCVMLGCDDRLLPNYIEIALRNIGEADLYQPFVDVIDKHGNKYLPLGDKIKRLLQPRKSGLYYGQRLAASLCTGNWLYFPSIVWRTAAFQKYRFNENLRIVQDVDLQMRMLIDGHKLFFDRTVTFEYRRFEDSASSKALVGEKMRFAEENAVYDKYSLVFKQLGWNIAYISAKLRLTSRINSLLH